MTATEEEKKNLETLLSQLRARYASGDRTVELKIRAVAAQLEKLTLKPPVTDGGTLQKLIDSVKTTMTRRRRCCGSR
jgi:hypothetical protein